MADWGVWPFFGAVALTLMACSGEPADSAASVGVGGGAGEGGAGEMAASGGDASQGGDPSGGGMAGAPQHFDLRVLTMNLQTFVTAGEAEARTALVADAILLWQPDFVALQEIAQSYDVDNRGEALAAATGYEWQWQVAHDFVVYQEGTGFLSRWPITWSASVALPHGDLGGTVERITIGAGIATPHGELSFFSSHATLDANEGIKADQALATWTFMNEHPAAAAFLGADMNAQPDTLAMRFLRGEASHDGQTGDLVDAWLAHSPADPGLTNPLPTPDKRIDYVYARGATVMACQHILDQPVDGLHASDHIGVMCDFALP